MEILRPNQQNAESELTEDIQTDPTEPSVAFFPYSQTREAVGVEYLKLARQNVFFEENTEDQPTLDDQDFKANGMDHVGHRQLVEEVDSVDTDGYVSMLTEREREIAALKSKGYTAQQIAETVHITLGTAKSHLHNISEKRKRYLVENEGDIQEVPRATAVLTDILHTNSDLSRLSPREVQISELVKHGYDEQEIAQMLQLNSNYVSSCIHRIVWMQTLEINETERRIKELISQGKSNKEISEALQITVGSVKNSTNRLFRKLGIQDRTELWTDEATDRLSPQYITVEFDRSPSPNQETLLPEERFLTEREYEVANLLITENLNNQELADKLGIEMGTIKHHTNAIYKKLGIRRREEIIREKLELFKPFTLQETNEVSTPSDQNQAAEIGTDQADENVLTLEDRIAMLPSYRLEYIVPLEPEKILTDAEMQVFQLLAMYETVEDAQDRIGFTFGQALRKDLEISEQKHQVCSNEELAQRLNITSGTAKNHVHSVLDKLNLPSRYDAVQLYRFYQQEGIL